MNILQNKATKYKKIVVVKGSVESYGKDEFCQQSRNNLIFGLEQRGRIHGLFDQSFFRLCFHALMDTVSITRYKKLYRSNDVIGMQYRGF